jgi:hypothetical protein
LSGLFSSKKHHKELGKDFGGNERVLVLGLEEFEAQFLAQPTFICQIEDNVHLFAEFRHIQCTL